MVVTPRSISKQCSRDACTQRSASKRKLSFFLNYTGSCMQRFAYSTHALTADPMAVEYARCGSDYAQMRKISCWIIYGYNSAMLAVSCTC